MREFDIEQLDGPAYGVRMRESGHKRWRMKLFEMLISGNKRAGALDVDSYILNERARF